MARAAVSRVRRWLIDDALPTWAQRGLDRDYGGSFESLSLPDAQPAEAGFKRLRVVARQLYVFSHAEVLGWPGTTTIGARAAADLLFDFLQRAWQGPALGWPRRLTQEGAPLDQTPDLYDHAFVLFALAWRHRATGDEGALMLARRTLDVLDRRFRHPSGRGFHNELPPTLPRQQNPHMHLMEATLALAETSGEQRFFDLANELAELFGRSLFVGGVIPEFYEDDFTVATGERGRWIEPGHMFEWAWILAQHQRLSGRDHRAAVEALVGWAERLGVDPASQVTFNAVRDDGEALDRGSRTWPNTERIKGWIALSELTGADPWPAIEGSVDLLFARYLDPAPRGCWIDAYDADGRAVSTSIPASTLYHLFLAFSEMMRADGARF